MLSQKVHGGGRIFDGLSFVQTLVKLDCLLKVIIAVRQLDAPLLTPKQIWTNRDKAMRRVPICDAAQKFIHAKNFLQHDDARAKAARRQRHVGVELSTVK